VLALMSASRFGTKPFPLFEQSVVENRTTLALGRTSAWRAVRGTVARPLLDEQRERLER
jgi:hypothetical protein